MCARCIGAPARWLYGHLLDGDLASNHLSWQWVAGTGSSKSYLFNADDVARYAPAPWHSPGSVIDTSYEALDRLARQPGLQRRGDGDALPGGSSGTEQRLAAEPPDELGLTGPAGRSDTKHSDLIAAIRFGGCV